jgi:hypothetical protein
MSRENRSFRRPWAYGLGLILLLAVGVGLSAWSSAASSLEEAPLPAADLEQTYVIWGHIVDSVTGLPLEDAAVRVYRRDPVTGEFWGIHGPDDIYVRPNDSGYWSIGYDGEIEWLVVKLFYGPGWVDLIVNAPAAASVVGQRVDLRNPEPGSVGPFDFTIVLPTPTPTSTATPTATNTPTNTPTSTPTSTPTETPEPTGPPPTLPPRMLLPLVVQHWEHL